MNKPYIALSFLIDGSFYLSRLLCYSFIIFIILKFLKVISWSWWIVLTPLWLIIILMLLFYFLLWLLYIQ